jgi:acylpyruvate hydrolase
MPAAQFRVNGREVEIADGIGPEINSRAISRIAEGNWTTLLAHATELDVSTRPTTPRKRIMKLVTCRVKASGKQFIAGSKDGVAFVDLAKAESLGSSAAPAFPADMLAFLAGGDAMMTRAAAILDRALASPKAGSDLVWSADQLSFLPAVPRPGKIIHTSVNFSGHKKEVSSVQDEVWKAQDWSKFHYQHPTGFLQAPSSTVGTGENVVIPRFTEQLDYEIELAIVIGKIAKDVSVENALDYVAGYCVFNDMSAREIQGREHANKVVLLGKCFDTSCPLGPWITTRDEISDPEKLQMQLRMNGELRQDVSTSEMVWSVRKIISWWSQITLEPGDIITSGTPSGVIHSHPNPVWLKPGDKLEASITGLGTLTNLIAAK